MTEPAAGQARIGDIARAFAGAGQRRELVAVLLGASIGALLSVSVGLLLGASPAGDVWVSWPLSWLSLSDAFLVAAVIVSWQVASILLLERRVRRAHEAHTWIGEHDLARWQQVTGSGWWSLPPTSPSAAQRWLRQHPVTATNGYACVEVMLLAGQLDEAASALDALVPRSDAERIAHADLRATLRLMAMGEIDFDELRDAVESLSGDDRLAGRCAVATMEARRALRTGGDWLQPYLAVRDELGARADGILWRRFLPRRLLAVAPSAAIVVVAFGLVRLLLGA